MAEQEAPAKAFNIDFKLLSPIIGLLLILFLILCLLFSLLGPGMMLPGHQGFALYACWVCGLLGGKALGAMGQPPLLGMLIAGIALRNIGSPSFVEPLPETWSAAVRVFGLSIILMRSGLELDLSAIGRIGPACVRLTVCPGCSEAVMVGIAGSIAFGMPVALALSLGFILAAVSPAVVVGGMFDLQRRGYGIAKGIPSLVVAAASFDDVVAITGYSLCIGFAITHEGANLLWEAMHGPINVALGMSLGVIGGMVVSYEGIWDTHTRRTAATGLVGLLLAFACNSIHFTGAGALASLVTTCVAARQWGKLAEQQRKEEKHEEKEEEEGEEEGEEDGEFWNGDGEEGYESEPSKAEKSETAVTPTPHSSPAEWAHVVEDRLAQVWSLLAQPLLFCVIGAALNFAELDPGTIPLSIAVVICGVLVRCPVAALAVSRTPLSQKERAFVGLAWVPKATVQAALGGVPLDVIRTTIDPEHDPAAFAKYEKWGLQILTTAVFSILITAPIGLLVIQNLGHRWLSYDGTDSGKPESRGQQFRQRRRPNTFYSRALILRGDSESEIDRQIEADEDLMAIHSVGGSRLSLDMSAVDSVHLRSMVLRGGDEAKCDDDEDTDSELKAVRSIGGSRINVMAALEEAQAVADAEGARSTNHGNNRAHGTRIATE